MREKTETSEYFSEGDSSSIRWKHQDDNEWSRERIKCLGKGIVDISSEASQPVDSLVRFIDKIYNGMTSKPREIVNLAQVGSPLSHLENVRVVQTRLKKT